MKVDVRHSVEDFTTYRAARVKSLFNCEDAATFSLTADLDADDNDWRIGLVVGPSGSGKTSIGRSLWDGAAYYDPGPEDWPADAPIVDGIAPDGSLDDVTGSLAAVGLGEVRAWLRPYRVLSTGQRFRADLARIVAERPDRVVVDEFTSVVDRQIARVGAQAFGKAWRRTGGQAVLLSCHYDIVEWLQPDWVFDTGTGEFTRGSVQPRPLVEVEVRQGSWSLWPLFEPFHYLAAGPMPAAKCYVGFIDGEPVAHLGVGTKNFGKGRVEARACRMAVMPEWQGAGVGMRFLNRVCELQAEGRGVLEGRKMTTTFHTSHPQLCAALRRDRSWRQLSAVMHGGNRRMSAATIARANGAKFASGGYGGHFRAVQGFRYYGEGAAA